MPEKKRTVARVRKAPAKKKVRQRPSPKQELFPVEYLKDLNATQACLRLGYAKKSASVVGSNLFAKYKAEIDAAMAKRILKTHITAARVLQEIAYIAFSDSTRLMEYGNAWVKVRDSKDLDKRDSAAIAGIEFIPGKDGDRIKFKMHDKMKALHMLCQHLGMVNKEGEMIPAEEYREKVKEALNGGDGEEMGVPSGAN